MYVTCKSVGSGARLRGFFLLPEASGGVSLVQGRFALSEPLPALEHGGYDQRNGPSELSRGFA